MGLLDIFKSETPSTPAVPSDQLNEALKPFESRLSKAAMIKIAKRKSGEGIEDFSQLGSAFGVFGNSFEAKGYNTFYKKFIDNATKDAQDRIMQYRSIARYPEIAEVIEDIINESTQVDNSGRIVKLTITDPELAANSEVSKKLVAEFYDMFYHRIEIQKKIDTLLYAYYVDSKVFWENIIDTSDPKKGIINIKPLATETMDFSWNPYTGKMNFFIQFMKLGVRMPTTFEEALSDPQNLITFYPKQITYLDYGLYGSEGRKDILGYLEKVKQPFNQLKLIETSIVIYRLIRSPERLVFKIDTGNMPPDRAMRFVESVKRSLQQKVYYDPNEGKVSNQPNVMCLALDTEIMVNGQADTLQNIIDRFANGEHLEVISVDEETCKSLPGKIVWAGITRKNAKVVQVYLSNGSIETVTPDHKFVLANGDVKDAIYLTPDDDLMPYNGVNVKVNSIRKLDSTQDTGCITVQAGNEVHNFLLKSGVYVRNSVLDNYFLPQCLKLDTEIEQLDGKSKTLQQLIDDYEHGITNYVYSISPASGKPLVGEIEWAGITRRNAKLVKVVLDNGKSITCTPDHRFILKTGEECEAQNLQPGTSLMPLYKELKQISRVKDHTKKLYEAVLNPKTGKWLFTHRLTFLPQKGMAIHHKDFNKFNNRPDNLIMMGIKEHMELHFRSNHIKWSQPGAKEEASEFKSEWWKTMPKENYEQICSNMSYRSDESRKKLSKDMSEKWQDPEFREKALESLHQPKSAEHRENVSKGVSKLFASEKGKEVKEKLRKSCSAAWTDEKKKSHSEAIKAAMRSPGFTEATFEMFKKKYYEMNGPSSPRLAKELEKSEEFMNEWNKSLLPYDCRKFDRLVKQFTGIKGGYNEFRRQNPVNHKVVEVIFLEETADTGCLTIKDPGDNHNFAVSAGVFIKNSASGRGSQIESVGGNPSGFAELDDLHYFQKKLYRALKYPMSRVEHIFEQQAKEIRVADSSGEIVRDETKWGRFLKKHQDKFSDAFLDLFMLDLEFKGWLKQFGINRDMLQVSMTVPNDYIGSMQQVEFDRKWNNYQTSDHPEFSKYWRMKRILKLTDEEIQENVDMLKKDKELGLTPEDDNGY